MNLFLLTSDIKQNKAYIFLFYLICVFIRVFGNMLSRMSSLMQNAYYWEQCIRSVSELSKLQFVTNTRWERRCGKSEVNNNVARANGQYIKSDSSILLR